MTVVRYLGPLAAGVSLLAGSAWAETPTGQSRVELRVLGANLDGAVRRVSRASYQAASGATRSYLLPGVGALFVLPPQSLPAVALKRTESPALRALADAIRGVEESLRTVKSPEERARLEQSLRSLRQNQTDLAGPGFAIHMSTGPEGELTVETSGLVPEDAASQLEQLLAAADQDLEMAMERQFRDLQEQAEALRRHAERARHEAERSVRLKLRRADATLPPTPPTAPDAPLPVTAEAPEPPPAPPWHAFFELGEPADPRSPEAVIQEVRQAVMHTLVAQAGRLASLRPEEQVVVAVDFLPARRFGTRPGPERTLVLRVPKAHLDEVKAGRLSFEEFGRRVQVSEY